MRRYSHKRILAGVLAAAMLLSGCSGISSSSGSEKTTQTQEKAPAVFEDQEKITLGQAADYLLAAAGKYNRALPSREELMDNFMGITENGELPRVQALIMVSRAFGELPKPVGNDARLAPGDVDLSQVPEWAREEIEKLKEAGVLAQTDLGEAEAAQGEAAEEHDGGDSDPAGGDSVVDRVDSSPASGETGNTDGVKTPESPITGKELKTIVRRIYALYGTELKDDFYTAVNKKDLDQKEIPAGETDAGGTYDQTVLVQKQVNGIIREIVEGGGYEPGSREQKIQDFYNSAVNFETRNALGAEPLRKYLNAIDSATDWSELNAAQVLARKEIGCGGLLALIPLQDPRDTQKTVPTLMPPVDSEEADESLQKLWVRLLMLGGETEEEAKKHVEAYQELKRALSKYAPSEEDFADLSRSVRYVTPEELQALLPGLDVKAIIEASGDPVPSEICLMSPSLVEGLGKLLQDETYLPAVKTALKLEIFENNYMNLSQDFLDAFDAYNQETMGQAADNSSPEEIAYAMVASSLGDYVDQLYAERYFPKEAKESIEEMVKQFIAVYRERIEKLDWMSEETKEAAIRKLDGMKFLIGYPDEWDHTLDALEVTDSFFDNQISVAKLRAQRAREEAAEKNRGESKNTMKIPVATVNAYYDQYTNTMCFPAGILQAPSFDIHASLEENLGGIGTVIAHEITHAFDNIGAKFDENGNQTDWWSAGDYEKFQTLCGQAADFYDGWESAPGIAINGSQTLGENIADIGGVACALEVLKKTENPDYDLFFRSYARQWLKCTTRARAESLAEVDEHSSGNLRVNRVLVNFQEFYDTYGIQPGDGMYTAPEDRIRIW
jgi:putative endopeptidase